MMTSNSKTTCHREASSVFPSEVLRQAVHKQYS